MRIRAETHLDRDGIAPSPRAAFGKEREVRMIEAVRASTGFAPDLSLVAEKDGLIIRHVPRATLRRNDRRPLELGPISVLPDRQRRGVGSALVRRALRLADARGDRSCSRSAIRRTTHRPGHSRLRARYRASGPGAYDEARSWRSSYAPATSRSAAASSSRRPTSPTEVLQTTGRSGHVSASTFVPQAALGS